MKHLHKCFRHMARCRAQNICTVFVQILYFILHVIAA